jgi:hypothetical protein
VNLASGQVFSLESKMKDIYPEFNMHDPNATEMATVADFMSESSSQEERNGARRPDELVPDL